MTPLPPPLRALLDVGVFTAVEACDASQLASVLAGLTALQARAVARLGTANEPSPPATGGDRLLDVKEAAALLGMSIDWVYRRARRLPFTVRMGRTLRFSETGIQRWLAHRH